MGSNPELKSPQDIKKVLFGELRRLEGSLGQEDLNDTVWDLMIVLVRQKEIKGVVIDADGDPVAYSAEAEELFNSTRVVVEGIVQELIDAVDEKSTAKYPIKLNAETVDQDNDKDEYDSLLALLGVKTSGDDEVVVDSVVLPQRESEDDLGGDVDLDSLKIEVSSLPDDVPPKIVDQLNVIMRWLQVLNDGDEEIYEEYKNKVSVLVAGIYWKRLLEILVEEDGMRFLDLVKNVTTKIMDAHTAIVAQNEEVVQKEPPEPIPEELDAIDNATRFGVELKKVPDNDDRAGYTDLYLENFGRFILKAKEEGDSARRKRIEEAGVEYLLDLANNLMANLIASNAGNNWGRGNQLFGLFDALRDFGRDYAERFRDPNTKSWGDESDTEDRRRWAGELNSRSIELVSLAYLDDLSINHGSPESRVSDWKAVADLEPKEPDFGMENTFDFLMHAESSKEFGLEYRHRKVMKLAMWQLPQWIREFERDVLDAPWDDRAPVSVNEKFNDFFRDKVLAEVNKVESRGTQTYTLSSEDERWDSKTERLKISKDDVDGLLDSKSGDLKVLMGIANRLSTVVGVRQHLFLNELARGTTPAGAMQRYSEWLYKVSPFSLANYKCYKATSVHMLAETFGVKWNREPGNEKQDRIVKSIGLTRQMIDLVGKMRESKVEVGDITSGWTNDGRHFDAVSPIRTPAPDLYTIAVRSYEDRQKESTSLEAWLSGLEALNSFVEEALQVPGGVSDIDTLKDKNPKKLRKELAKSLGDLIRKKISPMKANLPWIRWEHVAQFVLGYIDRMYRVYQVCDQTPGGRALLTKSIRETIVSSSVNIGGIRQDLVFAGDEEVAFGDKDSDLQVSGMDEAYLEEVYGDSYQKETGSKAPKREKPDFRDYVLNRTLRYGGPGVGDKGRYRNQPQIVAGSNKERKASPQRARGLVLETSKNEFSLRSFNRLEAALKSHWMRFIGAGEIPEFEEDLDKIIFGTPKEQQKKVEGDSK